eukprot:c31133_g1_i1 orf=2-247(-)
MGVKDLAHLKPPSSQQVSGKEMPYPQLRATAQGTQTLTIGKQQKEITNNENIITKGLWWHRRSILMYTKLKTNSLYNSHFVD